MDPFAQISQAQPGDPTQPPMPGNMMGGGPPGGGPPGQAGAVGSPIPGFPSTDPNIVGQIIQQAQQQGPAGMLQGYSQVMQLFDADEAAFKQRQEQILQMLMQQLMPAPQGQPGQSAPGGQPQQPPLAVGGQAAGGY